MDAHWEHFEHGADIGVRGFGPTRAAAFEQAALALTAVIADPATVRPTVAVPIECAAADDELLLAAWLNAVVYEMAVRRMLFSRFEVRLDGVATPFAATIHDLASSADPSTHRFTLRADIPSAPGVRAVRSVLAHIAFGPSLHEDLHKVKKVTTLQGYDFGGIMARNHAEESKPRTKAQLVGLLESEGERFAQWIERLTPGFLDETYTDPTGQNPKTRFEGLLSAKEHEMHHRAQLMLVERLLGITPHLTRQMQERMAAAARS